MRFHRPAVDDSHDALQVIRGGELNGDAALVLSDGHLDAGVEVIRELRGDGGLTLGGHALHARRRLARL